jgi:hypothetical protein
MLTTVDYTWANKVPVPRFNSEGRMVGQDMVPATIFPRQEDHLGRILIGYSTGNSIYPSALPRSIHRSESCRWFYQLHVFLHEYWHTIEYLRRDVDSRSKIVLETKEGKTTTFQEWWETWEYVYTFRRRTQFVTRYAATHADDLLKQVLEDDYERFTKALAEQICESFVGYILGIVPNDEDVPSFKQHSPEEWVLMDNLANSRVLHK